MKRKVYGLPFKGSKSRLAEAITSLLPSSHNLIDLFAGGGAVSHCAMMGNKFSHIHINDINPMLVYAFQMALNGAFQSENRFISREDFFLLRQTDPYASLCFSFGNDMRSYLYGKDRPMPAEGQRKEYIERLRRIQSMKYTAHNCTLSYSASDYREVYIPPHSVIYADIPYKDTNKYPTHNQFDHQAFYDWASTQHQPLFISSYELPQDRFIAIQEYPTYSKMSAYKGKKTVERIYIPSHQKELVYTLIKPSL